MIFLDESAQSMRLARPMLPDLAAFRLKVPRKRLPAPFLQRSEFEAKR
jgi:hypothetical protein